MIIQRLSALEVLVQVASNILFLDLSSKSSGYAIASDQLGEIIDYGLITSSSDNTIKRVYKMQQEVGKLIQEHNIIKIVMEEVRPDFQNARTYKVLTWLQGAIALKAFELNNKIQLEYTYPSEWRKKIGIHTGRGIKREVLKKASIQHVKDKYNIDANDDVCDAICLMDAYFIDNKSAF